jgi:hypothetical protein
MDVCRVLDADLFFLKFSTLVCKIPSSHDLNLVHFVVDIMS